MHIHSSLVQNSWRVGTDPMCIDRQMDEQNVYPYNEMLFSHKKKWTTYGYMLSMNEPWKHYAKWKMPVCVLSCFSLCDAVDCSPPGSSVHESLQARILQWVAMFSSRGSSRPRDWTCVSLSPALAGNLLTNSAIWEAQVKDVTIKTYYAIGMKCS